jgi:hypothetical protein
VISAAAFVGWYLLWSPGDDVRNGRHDRGENGLWLAHGWIGGDPWFAAYKKESEKPKYRSTEALASLTERVRRHGISELFPHLCPTAPVGSVPPVDHEQMERFLDAVHPARVWPWVGGADLYREMEDPAWKQTFAGSVRALLSTHPRLSGVHVNIEPMRDGTASFLALLDALRSALPEGRKLSVAAYPPPTRWQRSDAVHWSESYFREVSRRSDHLAVMMYDTGIPLQSPIKS